MLISDSFASVAVLPPPPEAGPTETLTAHLRADSEVRSDIGATLPDLPSLASDSALIADMQALLQRSVSGVTNQHTRPVQHTSLSSTYSSSTDLSAEQSASSDQRS